MSRDLTRPYCHECRRCWGHWDTCPVCNGDHWVEYCPKCLGRGRGHCDFCDQTGLWAHCPTNPDNDNTTTPT